MGYPSLPRDPSADALEKQLLATWKHERLFARVQEATRYGPPFVFYEGPPTANGRPGIHHVFARTIKDLVCRYHTMLGQGVTRIAGWDTHGLPVEIEVERQLQINGKKQIEAFGVEKFNRMCRESVFTYKTDWEALSDRTAYWLDYEHPYITYTKDYIETVWWLLRRLHDRGYLYRGHKVLPYCPRCGTALSSHELALGYDQEQTNSVYVTFPLADDPQGHLVVWTTTPWTLLSNVAVAVHPDLEYGEYALPDARGERRRYLAATARAGDIHVHGKPLTDGELVRTFQGRELVGQQYRRALDVVPLPPEGKHEVVVAADFVSAEDGSGLVHMAPAFGADDYAVGQQQGLAFVNPVAADGTLQGTSWPEIEGKLVTDKATNAAIIERLKHEGRWLETRPLTHTYPFCWRCDSPLIYYARSSWFVRTTAFKQRLLEANAQVQWHPSEIGTGRFGEWLANNVDWAISRDRYWGTPLNVWECERDREHREVIGSYEELAARSGRSIPDDFDPHKPFIDALTWPCRTCPGTMRRVPEVIDAWFDSGAMPAAQWHYPFEHEAEFKAHFPADYICEGVDQTRGWFYSLLAISTLLFKQNAYRNVICLGLVVDPKGKKASKSRGNVLDPNYIFDNFGSDAVRWYFFTSTQVGENYRTGDAALRETVQQFFIPLWNCYSFFVTYARLDNFDTAQPQVPIAERHVLDRWLLSRLNGLNSAVTGGLDRYDAIEPARRIQRFVDDLSNWYIRRSRRRFWKSQSDRDKLAAYQTLFQVLDSLSRLMAPFAPFIADAMYRNLSEGGSVHLADFPEPSAPHDPEVEANMAKARQAVELGLSARDAVRIKVRQPLASVSLPGDPLPEEIAAIVREELNVKRLIFGAPEVKLDTEITEELRLEGLAREVVRLIQDRRKKLTFNVEDRIHTRYDADGMLVRAIEKHGDYIKNETLSLTLEPGRADGFDGEQQMLEGEQIWIGLKRA